MSEFPGSEAADSAAMADGPRRPEAFKAEPKRRPDEHGKHAPIRVTALDGMPGLAFITCACGENRTPHVWLRDHWTGGPEAGKLAVRDVIAAQSKEPQ